MKSKYTREDIIRIAKESNVKFIRLQFTDIFGSLKNVSITTRQLEKALDNQCMFDGSSIEGFVRIDESDMYLYPDVNTFEIFPWSDEYCREARIICNVHKPNKEPFLGDPRQILIKAIEEAKEMGYIFNVGPECEFFLFERDDQDKITNKVHDDADYFDIGTIDFGEETRRDISLILEEMGFEIEAAHHEAAPGQHEIDFKYADALTTADNILTLKLVVKLIAREHHLHATFMPKPLVGVNGSGMHVNVSLADVNTGENLFCDEKREYGLSVIAEQFIAGLMEHIKAITAITNPLVNSYKRLLPGYEAPVYIAWSAENRSPLIRIPSSRGAGTRVELRSPDPSANPYLTLAVILKAGLDGIKRGLKPPKATDGNIYEMSAEVREKLNIESIPGTLKEAIDFMEQDPLLKEALGEHAYNSYIKAKRMEWEEYRTSVHEWEIDKYLEKY